MIEKLKKTYETYEGSSFFIDCVNDAFIKCGQNESKIKWFVNNHFQIYKECDLIQMKKCAAHWRNVSFDKLNQLDFLNYRHTIFTLTNYRMMVKIMEHYEY
jgi:7,8-dihydro-6-hydroxymethylpterin-pyrophosphokinase